MPLDPSTSQVNKAASIARKWMRGELDQDDPRIQTALEVIFAFRSQHAQPLVSANMGLRSMLTTTHCPVEVTQRLKRYPTMLEKLIREPTLPLSRMQDIGGVRAILQTVEQIRKVEARIRRNRTPVGYKDYIAHPRSSGYRGVHVIVQYRERNIEIQLRTRAMHEWAYTVEKLGNRFGENYKRDGDSPVQKLMAAISTAMAAEERGDVVTQELLAMMRDLRTAAGLQQG